MCVWCVGVCVCVCGVGLVPVSRCVRCVWLRALPLALVFVRAQITSQDPTKSGIADKSRIGSSQRGGEWNGGDINITSAPRDDESSPLYRAHVCDGSIPPCIVR